MMVGYDSKNLVTYPGFSYSLVVKGLDPRVTPVKSWRTPRSNRGTGRCTCSCSWLLGLCCNGLSEEGEVTVLQLGYDFNSKDLKLHNTTQGYTYVNLLVNLQGDVMLVQRALILLQRHTVCL